MHQYSTVAGLSLDEIKKIIQKSMHSSDEESEDSEFQQLAQFIITGKTKNQQTKLRDD